MSLDITRSRLSLTFVSVFSQGVLRINPKSYKDAYISAPVNLGIFPAVLFLLPRPALSPFPLANLTARLHCRDSGLHCRGSGCALVHV